MAGKPIPVGDAPINIAFGHDSVWVICFDDGAVVQIDAAARAVTGRPIRVGSGAYGVAVAPNAVWVTTTDGVVRIDPDTRRVVARIPFEDILVGIAVGAGGVWSRRMAAWCRG